MGKKLFGYKENGKKSNNVILIIIIGLYWFSMAVVLVPICFLCKRTAKVDLTRTMQPEPTPRKKGSKPTFLFLSYHY